MKKIVPFIILMMFFSFVIYIVSKSSDTNINIEYVDDLYPTDEIIKVCVLNEDNQLVLIDITKHNDENIYAYVIKLYDHYRNNLPLKYKTPLNGNFEVLKVEKDQDNLNINIKMLYLDSGLNEFLNALVWSYQDLGINKLNVNINGSKFVIEKNASINPIIESSSIYGNQKQIIFYENNGEIIPVTYFHKEDKVNFLMNKIKSKYDIEYDVEVVDEFLVVNIEDEENNISKSVINLIIKSIEQMGEFNEIVIVMNGEDIYNN